MKNKLFSTLILIIFVLTTIIGPASSNLVPVTGDASLTSETINFKFQTINFNKFYQFIKNVTTKKSKKSNINFQNFLHF